MAYIVTAYTVVAYIVMAYIIMAYVVTAYIVMAPIGTATAMRGLHWPRGSIRSERANVRAREGASERERWSGVSAKTRVHVGLCALDYIAMAYIVMACVVVRVGLHACTNA